MRMLQAPPSPTRVLSAVVTLLLLAPAVAIAQAPQRNAPAGNAGIEEYLETIPGATGNRPSRPPGGDGGASNTPALTAAQRARLERLGPNGKALADVVDATSPAGATPRKKTPATKAAPSTGQGRSPLSGVLDAAAGRDGGGMGALLPGILAATALGVGGLVFMRRRSIS